jgi:ABC-2 type transport system permease protein
MSTITTTAPTTQRGPAAMFQETWALYRRAMLKLFRRPVILYFSLVQPMIWLLLFGNIFSRVANAPGFAEAFGGQSYLAFFAPSVVLQTILFGAGQSGLGLISDLDSGFLSKLLTTPINRLAILLGRVLGDLTRMLLQGLVILLLTWLFGLRFGSEGITTTVNYAYGPLSILGALLISLLFGLVLSGLNVAIALGTRSTEATFLIGNFLTFPLLFTSSALLPNQILPDWLRTISQLNPVTHTINALRGVLYGPSAITEGGTVLSTVLLAVAILALLAVVTLTMGTRAFRRVVS